MPCAVLRYLSVLQSPSLRGRGLKLPSCALGPVGAHVALFARAWIEMQSGLTIGGKS